MSIVQVHRVSFWLLLVFCGILSLAVVNLLFFANQGARYTRADGAREEAARIEGDVTETKARIHGDLALAARIDELHNLLIEREAP